jgi:hypothetical protein
MPDYDIDNNFERRLAERLRNHSEQAVEPFDAVEIAHLAARRRPMRAEHAGRSLLPAPAMAALLTVALLVVLTVTAFAAGWLPLPPPIDGPSPTPTAAAESPAPVSPPPTEPTPDVTPDVTPEPTPEPTPAAPSPTPAAPSPTPAASPTAEPTVSPPPGAAVIGEWRRLSDFPSGAGQHVVVRDVTAGGPGFVAVGLVSDGAGNISGGRAWTSADGQTWSVADSPAFAGAKLEIVVEHLGVLYAFGPIPTDDEDHPDLGAYNIWRSTDAGQGWQLLPQPPPFAQAAVLHGATSAGETLVAWGSRNVEQGGQVVVRPGVWTWTPTAGGDWTLADTLPNTYDIMRMAYAREVLVAIGNDRSDEAPWRSIWYSTDEGRTWSAGDARFIDNPDVMVEDVAAVVDPAPVDHPGGVYAAVGWQGRDAETFPWSLGTTYYRDWFTGGPLTGLQPFKWERIAAIPGGFLVVGSQYRFEINENCAPEPCRDLIPIASQMRTASAIGTHWADGFGGLVWDEAAAPNAALWYYDVVAVGANGVVIVASDPDFNRSIWFAPLTIP